jgi:hypothetical protein
LDETQSKCCSGEKVCLVLDEEVIGPAGVGKWADAAVLVHEVDCAVVVGVAALSADGGSFLVPGPWLALLVLPLALEVLLLVVNARLGPFASHAHLEQEF